ncbi:YolD-like family protein [Brevibacillus fluminis]|uniref:YolD-like family protein n=1 Tax=Brevibacillus fluminis TaxID=511487 RepID=UPI003F8AC58E
MAGKIQNLFGASRFVLPEQREAYLQMREEEKLIPMPTLECDELASIDYLIRDSAREDYAVTITWWIPQKSGLGSTGSVWGVIKWIDQNTRRLKLVNDEDVQWIEIGRIINVIP